MKRQILIAATLATIVTSLITGFLTPTHDTNLPRNLTKPVLAAELVENADEIHKVYGTPQDTWHSDFVAQLRRDTWSDFAFILCYGFTFFLLGRVLGGKLGIFISILAWIAALADIIENIGILRITNSVEATDALAVSTRYPSLVKWTVLSIIWIGLLRLFGTKDLSTGWRVAELLTGILYACAGVLCITGVLDGNNKIEHAVPLLGLATLLQLAVCWLSVDFQQRHGLLQPVIASNRQSR